MLRNFIGKITKIKRESIKPKLIILGLFGAGMLPCPDCGAPMIAHFWPIAAALWISNTIKKRLRKETDAETLILHDEDREKYQ